MKWFVIMDFQVVEISVENESTAMEESSNSLHKEPSSSFQDNESIEAIKDFSSPIIDTERNEAIKDFSSPLRDTESNEAIRDFSSPLGDTEKIEALSSPIIVALSLALYSSLLFYLLLVLSYTSLYCK